MAYVAVAKALFDYAAQDPETELSFSEDQILYVIEKDDADWWKAKLKDDTGSQDGPVGLIPATYVEEIPPLNQTRSLFAYESTSPEELTMPEEATLNVFSIEEDWLLVRIGTGTHLGFVPKTYCEELDASAEVDVADAAEGEADVEESRRQEGVAVQKREVAETQRQLKLKDKVETWGIAEMDGKKKKKGTLGVGNGAVFFASDTDKMTPVKQYPINELGVVSQPSGKNLSLSFSSVSQPLIFHCGESGTASAILAKLESSKAAAGEALEMTSESRGAVDSADEVDTYEAPVASTTSSKAVRWAASPATTAVVADTATVLYDFAAQGEDELSVKENELVTIVDRENDEWWTVENAAGQEGVVPAQYVQLNDGTAAPPSLTENGDDSDDDGRRAAEEVAAAASLQSERQKEKERKVEQRRAIEMAAREKQRQEEEDRQYALDVEEKEKGKAERRERRREEEARAQREAQAEQRREAARGLEPPKISKRPSAQNVTAAAASLPPSRSKAAPERPPENSRPKPHAGRTRVWSDKSGQFKVEAEYLGLNENKIRLHKLNGVIIEVPVDKLSPEDVQMIKRHEARKAKAAQMDDDDVPLGRSTSNRPPSGPPPRSRESQVRAESPPIPAAALEMPKPRKPRYDWFAFFLEAGCDMDDCTRYTAAFERDRIDEAILPDLEAGTLRSLGLREGDVIRVRKEINTRFAKKTPEQQAQIKLDEEYARQLQEHENGGSEGPIPQPPPGLFTGPDGKLTNNTRRGRPDKKSTGPDTVDPSALAAVSDQLSRVSVKSPSPPPVAASPPSEPKNQPLISGFDDDAWTIKPGTPKPRSPAPPASPASPQSAAPLANTTESLLAQIQSLRPANTGISSNNTGGSFDRLSQMTGSQRAPSTPVQASQTGSSGFSAGSGYVVVPPNGQSMPSMGGQANGARGPLAPVPTNEGLLNPLQPIQTGFIPTRPSQQQGQQQGMMPQQTGWQQQQQPMMMQPTGFAAGFQQGYQQMQPSFTGYTGGFQQQQQAQQPSFQQPAPTGFNAIASIPPPQPQENPNKYAPSNIFAAMKKQEFGQPEEQQPQQSNKYDALRPLATGYNGAPGMMPQQTGMMQQQNGQNGMYGMTPQMTGYNGQMGYMGQQQSPYGQGYR